MVQLKGWDHPVFTGAIVPAFLRRTAFFFRNYFRLSWNESYSKSISTAFLWRRYRFAGSLPEFPKLPCVPRKARQDNFREGMIRNIIEI